MPPKVRVTKEDIIEKAVELVREHGAGAICARTLSAALSCSTQPIFSNFETMDDLRLSVTRRALELADEYTARECGSGKYPPYKARGMAYIRFAKEEKELFKLLYMRPLSEDEESFEINSFDDSVEFVRGYTSLDPERAKLFHLEIWSFVHGIASMHATGFLTLEDELVSEMLTDVYVGLRKRYGVE